MGRRMLIAIVIAVAFIMVVSISPIRYVIHEDKYFLDKLPVQNLSDYNFPAGSRNLSWYEPPNLTLRGADQVVSAMLNLSPSESGGSIKVTTGYWAFYNKSTNLVINVVEETMSTKGGIYVASGIMPGLVPDYRPQYKYSSKISIALPGNSSETSVYYNPDNTITGSVPSHWYFGYGNTSRLPFGYPEYGEGNSSSGQMLSTGMNMSYFTLNTVSETVLKGTWEFYDMNYQHSLEMHSVSYIVSTAFTPVKGVNYVGLNVSNLFAQSQGFVHHYYVVQESYSIPVYLS